MKRLSETNERGELMKGFKIFVEIYFLRVLLKFFPEKILTVSNKNGVHFHQQIFVIK